MNLASRFFVTFGLARDPRRIYLDNAATTRMTPRAKAALMECIEHCWANPSTSYEEGCEAKHALDWARTEVARAINVPPNTIHFTSCGTESNNIAIRSIMARQIKEGRHILVTSQIEHNSVSKTAHTCGCDVKEVPVDENGYINVQEYEKILTEHADKIGMISIILGQNEVGTIQDIKALSTMAKRILGDQSVPFHTDATQALGKIPISIGTDGNIGPIDMLSASAHKFHGPRGVGILYCANRSLITPDVTTMTGGGQESGARSGTENVPAIVSAAVALRECMDTMTVSDQRMRELRDFLVFGIKTAVPGCVMNSQTTMEFGASLPNIVNFSLPNSVHGHRMVDYLDENGISANAGSACNKMRKPSKTLVSMGRSDDLAHSAIRVSISKFTTKAECRRFLTILERGYGALLSEKK